MISVLTPITVTVSAEEHEQALDLVVSPEVVEDEIITKAITIRDTGNLQTLLSPTGELPATHYMSSGMWYVNEIEAIWNCMIPSVTITSGSFVEGELKIIKPADEQWSPVPL
jgi:hypothetical protein